MSSLEKFTHRYHEYERSKNNKEVYRCIHPECSHYKKRELLEGKRATCHKCKNTFILTWTQLRNKYPVCEFCTKSPKSEIMRQAREVALNMIQDIPDEIKSILVDNTLE